MPKFVYSAKKQSGQDVKGVVEADSKNIAISLLRERGYVVYSISEQKKSLNLKDLLSLNRISDTEKVNFTSNLATMVGSGLPLAQALEILVDQAGTNKMKEVVNSILKDVESGKALSDSMAVFPEVFDNSYISLVKAGEASGKLDEVLKRLAMNLEKQREFKNKIRSALLYPTIIVVAMIGVMIIIIVFVIPKLVEMYNSFDIELPAPTRFIIWLSDFTRTKWYLVLAIVAGLVIGFKAYAKTAGGRRTLGVITLKLPVFGKLLKEKDLTEFTRTLAVLSASGVSIVDGLGITTQTVSNPVYQESISGFVTHVKKGGALSKIVETDKNFPPIVSKMIKVGEETGTTDDVLLKVSKYYEDEVDRKLEGLATALEPLIMVFLGVMVGGLILAVITPIYKLTSSF